MWRPTLVLRGSALTPSILVHTWAVASRRRMLRMSKWRLKWETLQHLVYPRSKRIALDFCDHCTSYLGISPLSSFLHISILMGATGTSVLRAALQPHPLFTLLRSQHVDFYAGRTHLEGRGKFLVRVEIHTPHQGQNFYQLMSILVSSLRGVHCVPPLPEPHRVQSYLLTVCGDQSYNCVH